MSNLFRLLKIIAVCFQFQLIDLLPHKPMKLWLNYLTFSWLKRKPLPVAHRLRLALEALGPIFIKFGQMLSTRRDLLPEEFAFELAKLQDQVTPFDSQTAIRCIERELGKPITELFHSFDQAPLASASVAQVHSATLESGLEVIVKIIRPNINKVIKQDIRLLKQITRLIEFWIAETKRFHLSKVIEDYEQTITQELDLCQEAANTDQMRRNFNNSPLLYVPQIYWPYITSKIMVAERVYGIPINDIASLKQHGVNLEQLAIQGVEIFFTQVFRDNFFHADMHPGNILVDISNPQAPQYLALDCAIIGSLSTPEQLLLARQLMALFNQNYLQLATLLQQTGWVDENINLHHFAAALRAICSPIFEQPLDQIEFGIVLVKLFKTARQFNIQMLPQFVLLEKTLLYVEGLGRQLYPKLDIWTIGRPLLEEWLFNQLGPAGILRSYKQQLPTIASQIGQLPQLISQSMQLIQSHNNKDIAFVSLSKQLQSQHRMTIGVILSIAVILLLPLNLTTSVLQFLQQHWLITATLLSCTLLALFFRKIS